MTISEQLNRLAKLLGGKAWGIDRGKPRIYMPSRLGAVYFHFPDSAYRSPNDQIDGVVDLGGAAFRVHLYDCGQHPHWYKHQAFKITLEHVSHGLAITAAQTDDWQLAQAIMDDGPELDFDEMARHLVNAQLRKARQSVAKNKKENNQ